VMTHAQKPDFAFRRNGRVHLNRRGRQFCRLLTAEMCGISGSNAGYTVFRGSVKSTGYPLHSPFTPSLPLPCVTVYHHISTGVYCIRLPGVRRFDQAIAVRTPCRSDLGRNKHEIGTVVVGSTCRLLFTCICKVTGPSDPAPISLNRRNCTFSCWYRGC